MQHLRLAIAERLAAGGGAGAPGRRRWRRRPWRRRARSSTACAAAAMRPCARYAREFDGVELAQLRGERRGVRRRAYAAAGRRDRGARARDRQRRALPPRHAAAPTAVEIQPGVRCERLVRPIDAVGLYVPAGSAPLPSTVIMLAVPARIAGCARRVLCTPPQRDGRANAAVLVAAELCGIRQVFKIGGAQAIAAMAYGTESVPKVDKIFGPGNAWVTAAKQLVAADPARRRARHAGGPLRGAGDRRRQRSPRVRRRGSAGAGRARSARPGAAAHDLRCPGAERGCAGTRADAGACRGGEILRQSLAASRILVVPDLATAVEVSKRYAPEHLILQTRAPRSLLERIHNAGSVFLGAVVAGAHGRLLLRHQPRAADLWLCARLQRPVGARFHAPHHGAGADARRTAPARPDSQPRWRGSRDWMRTPRRSNCGCGAGTRSTAA